MTLPAKLLEWENPVEERIARLETKVDHIQSDVAELRTDARKLNDKIDAVDQKLTARIDSVKDSVTALALSGEKSFAALKIARLVDRVRWLVISGALLGIMARTFKWI